MKYYIADTHFGDLRIINLCNRPFKSMNEMIDTISNNWNTKVDPKDEVYVLGDVSYGYHGDLKELLDSLHGKKHLLVGNHDRGWMKNKNNLKAFRTINQISKISDEGRSVVLCHYPLLAYEGSLNGGYHVFGHVHNNEREPQYPEIIKMKRSFNAGVDINDFKPVSLDELISAKGI